MGEAFDATGSYEALLVMLAIGTLGVAALMLCMPGYGAAGAANSAATGKLPSYGGQFGTGRSLVG